MIQRIQSVWLLLVAAFVALTFKLPCYTGVTANTIVGTTSEVKATSSIPLMVVSAAIAILSFVAIFMFKKRSLQLRLCLLGILLQLLAFYLYYREINNFISGNPTLWSVLYFGGVFFFIFAARAIYKDEKLVKDSNRLR